MQKVIFRYTKTTEDECVGIKDFKKDTYRIKEEIVLPGTKESIGQILFFDISGRKAEIRPGQDELLIRGEAEVFCMYLSPEEKWNGLNRACRMREGFHAKAQRKI